MKNMGCFSNTNHSESPAICFAFFFFFNKKSQNGANLHRKVMVLNKRQREAEALAMCYFCRWKEFTSLLKGLKVRFFFPPPKWKASTSSGGNPHSGYVRKHEHLQ